MTGAAVAAAYIFGARACVCVCSADGLAPPIEEWQKAINDQLEKIRKLEEVYDNELIRNKVSHIRCVCIVEMLG